MANASARRCRPILLITGTTIAGLLAMALGLTGKSVLDGPFATAIVFGLGVASARILFLDPALYPLVDDTVGRVGGRRRAGRAAAAVSPVSIG